ncbi:E3 ubiquitin-protein ligase Iruka [Harmonia axyridis]|uniref:E3 ubiquitin-protein ligase Iruka n=1 Tax=Harmonia axyridis TaxID=115357 RepID=UPI001E277B18|nr:E3 ubiquitin-protein ligase Iruka [Harmonia axyridis]
MAEAAVDALRFYCHLCNKRFQSASSSFTCPFCSNGFIEEVSEQTELDGDGSDGDEFGVHIRDILMPGMVPFIETRAGRSQPLVGGVGGRSRGTSQHHGHPHPFRPNIENFIQDVIINLGGNMQFFLGNPGDYAWGREGLDSIITHLLNQMDSAGPPPLGKEVIDSLPVIQIEEDQVNKKLQCSVCWEDFILNEDVRQLPCSHVYHDGCIRPWLELHGTCPICRQNLGNNEQQSSDTNLPNTIENGPSYEGAHGSTNQPASSSSSDNSDMMRSSFSRD